MEDDEEISNRDKASIQVDKNEDGNYKNDINTEQCESVRELGDSQLADDSKLACELEPAASKDDSADVVGDKEDDLPEIEDKEEEIQTLPQIGRCDLVPKLDGSPMEELQPAGVSEPAAAKFDSAGVDDEERDIQKLSEIERCESVPELGGSRVSGESEPVIADGTAEDLQRLSNEEKCETVAGLGDTKHVGDSVPELDASKVVGDSESAATNDDVNNMFEAEKEDLEKCDTGTELDVSKLKGELELAQTAPTKEKEKKEENPEAFCDQEDRQHVIGSELGAMKDEETSVAVSEPSESQHGVESELAVVAEVEKDEEEEDDEEEEEEEVVEEEEDEEEEKEETVMEVPNLDDDQFVGEAEVAVAKVDEDEDMVAEEQEDPMLDTEMETETEVVEAGKGGGKRKRGRNSRVQARASVRKKVEEDVCFICFDGGDLVLCDRRGCPKAYHPSCVNRDEAFFRAKGRWNCGWHLCSICEKNAYYTCYTCTFSLCKGCIANAVILCIRGNKGFCETCMRTVMLIEKNELGNGEMAQVDFDDKSSWEYLFKDYWLDLKRKLLLTSDELAQAKNPWKGSDVHSGKQESPDELYEANNDGGSGSENSSGNKEASIPKRRKVKKRLKPIIKEGGSASGSDSSTGNLHANKSKRRKAKKLLKSQAEGDSISAASAPSAEGSSMPRSKEWASKELLEFVMHMKDGDTSVLSQFDVQALLLEYIKRNKLRDPRRKSQIICDSRLQNLFGKPRVGHFEMLKLLESHFLIREDSQADDLQETVVDTETSQLDADGSTDTLSKGVKDKKRKTRRKGDERGLQSNIDDYAAIDNHNINLVYLRRNLMEALLEDSENFHDKVVGSFGRIRISGSNQKQDMYRLVQVVGTSKAAEPYKVGKKTTDIVLEIQNLNKTEVISIDIISNQEFTEDECKRLRQSIKCGLINRLTVGDIQEKAMALQEVRVNDWLESEVVRLSHLRDRASDMGRRKELRECVEKLQLLKTPEERHRRLEEIPEVHADPKMDPSYESEEDEGETDHNKQENLPRPRGTGFSRRGRDPISPRSNSNDSWSATRNYSSTNRELSRSMSGRGFSSRREDASTTGDIVNENLWIQERSREQQQLNSRERAKSVSNSETSGRNSHSVLASESFSAVVAEASLAPLSTGVTESAAKVNEADKMWHYQDPSGKAQGPFSIVQLRKWSKSGYFPGDLKIWRTGEEQDGSILLTNALKGEVQKEAQPMDNSFLSAQRVHNPPQLSSSYPGKTYGTTLQPASEGQAGDRSMGRSTLSIEGARLGSNGWDSDYGSRNDASNLPSPTPTRTAAGEGAGQDTQNKVSALGANRPFSLMAPQSSQLSHLTMSPSTSANLSGSINASNASQAPSTQQTSVPANNKHNNGIEYSGVIVPSSVAHPSGQLPHGSENESSISLPGVDSTHNPVIVMGVSTENAVQFQAGGQVLPKPDLAAALVNPGVQSVTTHNPSTESHGWSTGSVSTQKLEQNNPSPMSAQQQGHWVGAPSVQNSAQSLSTGNTGGNFPTPGFSGLPPTDSWRPQVAASQVSMQLPAPPNLPWPANTTENLNSGPRPGQENPSTGWGPMPGNVNMAWGGMVPVNTNMNWGASAQGPGPFPGNANGGWVAASQGPPPGTANPSWVMPMQGAAPGNPNWAPPGNVNPGWVASGQGTPPGNANPVWVGQAPGNTNVGWIASGEGPAPGNANSGWVAPSQGPVPGNTNSGWVAPSQVPVAGNANSGWVAPGQGPSAPASSNPNWVAPSPNPGMWGSEQSHNGDRDRSQRDRASQGVDSGGSGGGRPWNRQSSFGNGGGGGPGRNLPKGQRVCNYHMSGHCKKGSSCDYLHP